MYACNAREWSVISLTQLYKWVVSKHDIDTLIILDGGSDSLMCGDEYGLGDPIEDAVSVAAGARLHTLRHKFLISVGFGSDRYNGVSDNASFRAISEITEMGGFRGSWGVEPDTEGFKFYQALLNTIYEKQTFRSVLSSLIVTAGKGGQFGFTVPENSGGRIKEGHSTAFVWPLMSHLFAFDVDTVARRSLIIPWIESAHTPMDAHFLLMQGRKSISVREDEGSVTNSSVVRHK